jgi:Mn-dependent DtxR family transcriptional regulator
MLTPQELNVLKLLAKEWDYQGPPGIMDTSDIVAALGDAPSETLEALKGLYQRGLIDMNKLKTAAFLTPEGYAAAEISE